MPVATSQLQYGVRTAAMAAPSESLLRVTPAGAQRRTGRAHTRTLRMVLRGYIAGIMIAARRASRGPADPTAATTRTAKRSSVRPSTQDTGSVGGGAFVNQCGWDRLLCARRLSNKRGQEGSASHR